MFGYQLCGIWFQWSYIIFASQRNLGRCHGTVVKLSYLIRTHRTNNWLCSYHIMANIYLTALPFIRLVGLQVNNPRCPLSLRHERDDHVFGRGSESMNNTEITLLDGANETCLPPFGDERRLWLLEFDVNVPENGNTEMVVQVVTRAVPCSQPMMTILVGRIFIYGDWVHMVECVPREVTEGVADAVNQCIFLCTQISPNVEGHVSIFLRVENFPFPQTDFENQSICDFSIQFLNG